MKLSIVIPCYNEEKNLPLILSRFKEVIKDESIEVILVNNGSTDNSKATLENLLPNYNFARVVEVQVNQGYGYGILQGLKASTGEFIGWTHADMQTDPQDVLKAYKLLETHNWNKNIMLKGKRKGRSIFDNIFTICMSLFETLYLRQKLSDINAQPNIFHRTFFNEWENPPYDFSLDLYALYMARIKGLHIIRFQVFFPKRIHGSSHWNTGIFAKWKFIKRTIQFSVKLKNKGIR